MLAADSTRARLDMMSVELGCSRQVVDVSRTSALRVNFRWCRWYHIGTSGVDLGGAGGVTSGVDLDGVVTEN